MAVRAENRFLKKYPFKTCGSKRGKYVHTGHKKRFKDKFRREIREMDFRLNYLIQKGD